MGAGVWRAQGGLQIIAVMRYEPLKIDSSGFETREEY